MKTPNQTTTAESEESKQLSTSSDSTRDYPVAADELFADVASILKEAIEQTPRHPARGVSESESNNVYVARIQGANGQETSFRASDSEETQTAQYELKQKWEGYVLKVGQETFQARLTPLAGEPGEHIANLYLVEVDKAERNLVKPGSIFYWSIGYRDSVSGRRRESFIRFQRLPHRSKRELEAARRRGKELLQLFGGE